MLSDLEWAELEVKRVRRALKECEERLGDADDRIVRLAEDLREEHRKRMLLEGELADLRAQIGQLRREKAGG